MNRGVVVALGLALVVAESAVAQVGPVPTPQLPKPPELPVPLPEVPSVPVPSVPVPVPVPSVPAPPAANRLPVPAPQVPAVRVPLPTAPQSSSGGSAAESVSRAAPSGSGGRSGPTSAARGGRAAEASGRAGAGAAGVRSPGRRARGSGAGAAAGAAQARDREAPRVRRRERRRQQRLRRTVGRYRTCLDGLPALERRVIVLRTGLGAGDPRTRAGVGRRLDISARRVGRLERRALRRLRGGCGGGSGTEEAAPSLGAGTTTGLGFSRALMVAATFGSGVPAIPGAQPERDQVRVMGEQQSSSDAGLGGAAPKLAPPAVAELPTAVVGRGPDGGGTDVTLPLLILVGLLAVALGVRSMHQDQPR